MRKCRLLNWLLSYAVSTVSETIHLKGTFATADAIKLLAAAIDRAVPQSEKGCDVKRTLLLCLLHRGLSQHGASEIYMQSSVHIAQVGEEMLKARRASPSLASSYAKYRKVSSVVNDVGMGTALVSVKTVAKGTQHVMLHVKRLKSFIPTTPSPVTVAVIPQPIPQPIPLPSPSTSGKSVVHSLMNNCTLATLAYYIMTGCS